MEEWTGIPAEADRGNKLTGSAILSPTDPGSLAGIAIASIICLLFSSSYIHYRKK
jgi:hypothetical protein